MRKLTPTILAVTALAGGALTGVALAAPGHGSAKPTETRSLDRHQTSSRDRLREQHDSRTSSRDRSVREHSNR